MAREYIQQLAREAAHWGRRLTVEHQQRSAWLDHPLIAAHYRQRGLIDGRPWETWGAERSGGACERTLELGCGSATRSLSLFSRGVARTVEGVDVSPERVAAGEAARREVGAPGHFSVADVNTLSLRPQAYDLIFSCHSFHHFEALEHVMDEVAAALKPGGLFILEEFVGPTQFQWTEQQMRLVRELTGLLPERFRTLPWGAIKTHEGRPTPAEVVAVSPFESIRSAEIAPLFRDRFHVDIVRPLGGTLQHLLYNGIIHNFADDDRDACRYLEGIWSVEDALIDAGLLVSDFQLLVGSPPQKR